MSKLRIWVLVVGPLPIFAASVALSDWARSEPARLAQRNRVSTGSRPAARSAARPAPAPSTPASAASLDEQCRAESGRLKSRSGSDVNVIVRPPFVIGGDMDTAGLERWYRQTISPAAAALGSCYFERHANHPVTVLLFSGEGPYTHYARTKLGDEGVSIYGYYKPRDRLLVMNIGTGGGTLVHELTHALMAFDFPEVPDWFNEGLASLHEQCRFRNGADGPWIEGLENWRLPALQDAIRKKRLRSLKSLIETDDFRGVAEGMNYAQARYFCLYMQRKGLLRDYYRRFRNDREIDPLGLAAVAAVFPSTSWKELDADYQKWVLKLEY